YTLLGKANRMEELIRNHWEIMGETDTERRVKLVVDEWGAWHQTDPTIDPSYLFAYYPTLRDALVSGITLDTFNRHADKVGMANAAQLVNNIHTSFLAIGDRFTVTPIYHVFRMYADHQGGTSVRTEIAADRLSSPAAAGLPSLCGSCSIRGKDAVLTIVNSDIQSAKQAAIHIRGANIDGMRATVLTSTDIHAHNTFDQPKALEPVARSVPAGTSPNYEFAPASVTKLVIRLT
ncbi:MAG: alpha-L-arabinofuranosidase C-terminal domain-containing protein, partial [Bryobacteraceae bacterium]